jgi:hypothetical protein
VNNWFSEKQNLLIIYVGAIILLSGSSQPMRKNYGYGRLLEIDPGILKREFTLVKPFYQKIVSNRHEHPADLSELF